MNTAGQNPHTDGTSLGPRLNRLGSQPPIPAGATRRGASKPEGELGAEGLLQSGFA